MKTLFLFTMLFFMQKLFAQKTILISTKNNCLALEVDKDSAVLQTYFGKKLQSDSEYININALNKFSIGNDFLYNRREAYVASGSLNLLEPALSVTQANGDKSTVLKYISHQQKQLDENRTLTSIVCEDPVYKLQVILYYQTYKNEDIIEQWVSIKNNDKRAIVLNKFASANLTLQAKCFYLKEHPSSYGAEMNSEEQKISSGIITLDSKLGTRTNLLMSSSFMVSLDKPATETEGDVIAASLEWSGNFRIDFQRFDDYYMRITAGINNFASNYTLQPNEVFETPRFVYTFSNAGKGLASRNLQNWARNYQLLDGKGTRLTLLNNWETTYFDFDDKKLSNLIQDTKKLGVDLFLLDDGWFGNKYPRNNAHAGLGDWQYNKQKLKNGISSLATEALNNGIKFGIWLEPEMVNPQSELYQNHPDWIIREPGRAEFYMRNQLVLDLSNPKVQDYIFNVIDGLFKESPNLAFIKWDCNSLIYNAHSPFLKNQDHFYIEYVKGLYAVLERVRAKYPKLPMMLCAGGGSRVDYAALKYFTEFWPSDNTNPFDRIFIQWEYSYYFPAIATDNHVTNSGNQSIKFKTDVAMMGKLGFDIRVNELSENDLHHCQDAVKLYNNIKDVIWYGQQYRLQSPYQEEVAAISYVDDAKDTAIIFNYFVAITSVSDVNIPIKMQGLDASKQYSIKEVSLYANTKSPIDETKIYSGDFLMNIGYNPQANARRTSVVLVVSAVQ